MSAYTHMPYTQSALRDVDPSRPAHTHTHCRQGEELEADAGQSTILAQGYTGDSLGPRTQTDTVAATDVHSLVPSQAGSDSVPHTGYLRLVQSGPGFVPATAGAHLSTNQVVLIPHRLAQSESLLANVGRDTQAAQGPGQSAQAPGTTQEEADAGKDQKKKRPLPSTTWWMWPLA